MASKGVERDTMTYSAAVSACEKGSQWEEALGLLREMASQGVETPSPTTPPSRHAGRAACGRRRWGC